MTLASFDWDIFSIEFPEVLTSLVLGRKDSWHFSTVDLDRRVKNFRLHLTYKISLVDI